MLKRMVHIIFIWMLSFNSYAATDTVDVRFFKDEKIREFKKQKEFKYDRNEIDTESFTEWLNRVIRDFFDKNLPLPPGIGKGFAPVIFYMILIVLVGLVIYYLSQGNIRWVFKKTDKTILQVTDVTPDNIHVIEYDKELEDAEKSGDLRRAVRLRYLRTLKYLHDNRAIVWTPEKTNDALLREIRNANVRSRFSHLLYHFEYVWYGEFTPDAARYEAIKAEFTAFRNLTGEVA